MEDLKIKVENNLDELVELFKGYGCKHFSYTCTTRNYILLENGILYFCKLKSNFKESKAREVSASQLKDLVVLKRNDMSDRNVIDPEWNETLYLDSSGNLFVFHLPTQKWKTSNFNGVDSVMNRLKTIESIMKEYLIRDLYGNYVIEVATVEESRENHARDWVEIPEGCNIITFENRMGSSVYFHWKSLDSDEFFLKDEKIWSNNFNETLSDFVEKNEGDVKIIWKREPKQKKEPLGGVGIKTHQLSFLKESLNDQYMRIEKFKQSKIKSISDTLKERQKEYGSFEDVAFLTQGLVGFLSKHTNYDNMPNPHKEALHMIASKVARLTLGNHNSIDGWHDISGYAKLIEDLIKG